MRCWVKKSDSFAKEKLLKFLVARRNICLVCCFFFWHLIARVTLENAVCTTRATRNTIPDSSHVLEIATSRSIDSLFKWRCNHRRLRALDAQNFPSFDTSLLFVFFIRKIKLKQSLFSRQGFDNSFFNFEIHIIISSINILLYLLIARIDPEKYLEVATLRNKYRELRGPSILVETFADFGNMREVGEKKTGGYIDRRVIDAPTFSGDKPRSLRRRALCGFAIALPSRSNRVRVINWRWRLPIENSRLPIAESAYIDQLAVFNRKNMPSLSPVFCAWVIIAACAMYHLIIVQR